RVLSTSVMYLDTLNLYCDVIRSGSFSLGAASHRISQSAASQAVRQLEEELGAQLIDRTKRPFMVTPEGKKFFEACLVLLDNFEAFDRGLSVRKAVDKALRQRGATVSIAMEFDNIETIKHAITIQSGVSILPRPSVAREVESGTLAAIPLDMPDLVRPIGIIHRRQKLLTPTAQELLVFLKTQKQ